MKSIYVYILSFAFVFALNPLKSQQLSGDLTFWEKADFLGFDEIGDCTGQTGDISSVYARMHGETLLLRVTFDNMVSRKENQVREDHFAGSRIELGLSLTRHANRANVINADFDLSPLQNRTDNIRILRTPGANTWEAEIDLNEKTAREDLEFSIAVKLDGKVVDYFLSDGRTSDATGNAAFVHHGNQGITYTEVFYGSPGGQSGLDGSGFDEVLQVHEATNIPGNFHMSGTLMPAAEWHNPEFNDWLHTLAGNGLIEMMTSALGQHIMPFLQNNMNDWSVDIECDMVNFQYNYQPRTAWVPERVWLSPGNYPDAGVIDWLGDNWTQHGVWGVVLDDSPHLNGYDNRKIHWMNNGMGIDLRVIPINNSFVGNMHYDANGAKNQIAGMGQYNICVYGTDWEVAAEMNEHDGTFFLDNYESVLWWCHDNYPGVNVWKLVDAMQNPDFNGTGAGITPGTYGLLGGPDGYGGSNNSWYTQWAATPSHSDFHDPKWTYGYIWDDAHNNLLTAPNNNLAQLGWYILMINLHETGWHDGGSVAGWEHRYSSHMKNANVYAHAARWADGQYQAALAAYYDDIDHDGVDEVVVHNQKIMAVFESIGGKVNWLFYKDGLGNAHSVVGSDMAYWSETDGDYNESSNNHVAALSDVYPYQQDAVYDINIIQSTGDTVIVELSQWGVKKRIELTTGVHYLDVMYDFFGGDGYVKSGFSPGLMDLVWSGKNHVQRMWGDYGSYCGQRNSSSGATVALVLGNGGAQHNLQFEGTLVLGDEIKGFDQFFTRLFAGYTSDPTGTTVPELNTLASENMDVFPPTLNPTAFQVDNNTIELTFSEALEFYSAQNEDNYTLQGFSGSYTIINAIRQNDWRKVRLTIQEYWEPGDSGEIVVTGVEDLNGNVIEGNNTATLLVPSGTTPHTIAIDGTNDFDTETELMAADDYTLYITWDNTNLYLGFEELDLNGGGDLFVNIDTDQVTGNGAPSGSWGRVDYSADFEADYQVAIEGGGGSIQLNHWANGMWHYPASNNCDSYEGWADNGLTEISVPWASMGNPEGIALSVHVSEEDSHMITAAFPLQNPTGDHPTLTHVYAFYIPHITSEMPVAGMEPNQATIMPNLPPEITDYQPTDLNPTVEEGESIAFSVTASDPDNATLDYGWYLDGSLVSEEDSYMYVAENGSRATQEVKVLVSDLVPGNDVDSVVWQVEVIPSSGLVADFTSDATSVCIGGDVQFSDLSTGDISSWSWDFEGGTPATSTGQNPLVNYPTAGTWDVSLTVSNAEDENTLTVTDYITVHAEPVAGAGADQGICSDETADLTGTASNYSSILWTTAGDGTFSNSSSLSTTYTPGANDEFNGSVEITLTAYPLTPCPDAASDVVAVNILTAPEIDGQPEDVSIPEGGTATFTVTASGSYPLEYQWYGPAGELAGETAEQLIIENVSPADAGDYYCEVTNACGAATSEPATLTIQAFHQHVIQIPDGWNGLSSYVVPADPMAAQIFSGMVSQNALVVIQNYSFMYWPDAGINTIDLNGGWNSQSGYQLKVLGDQELTITGQQLADKSLNYEAGWHLLPVLNECGVDPDDLFATVMDDVVILKEIAGLRLYWPGVFQNLYNLDPGKAYAVKFANPVGFTFPECDVLKSEFTYGKQARMVYLNDRQPTPHSHSVVISGNATHDLQAGDILLVSSENKDYGRITVQSPGEPVGFQLFGDDPLTPEKEWFEENDEFRIQLIRNEQPLIIAVDFDKAYNGMTWKNNGMTLIKSMQITGSAGQEDFSGFLEFYPNPAREMIFISDDHPYLSIIIYSSEGKKVIEKQGDVSRIDISELERGLYLIHIQRKEEVIMKKFVKQ